jgi:hypothetical protein
MAKQLTAERPCGMCSPEDQDGHLGSLYRDTKPITLDVARANKGTASRS